MNTTHFVIQKNVSNNRTVTTITRMNEDESIGELARLLGMDNVTDAVLDNAKEMRKTALETRNGD